jgi:hypothetical protein
MHLVMHMTFANIFEWQDKNGLVTTFLVALIWSTCIQKMGGVLCRYKHACSNVHENFFSKYQHTYVQRDKQERTNMCLCFPSNVLRLSRKRVPSYACILQKIENNSIVTPIVAMLKQLFQLYSHVSGKRHKLHAFRSGDL